ncbi:hypothetical protein QTP86_031203 [Hemibagrus guttatus]|nr:hypothetical protein QTP86_031203 [Hemibagrus guttatus]
MTLPLLCCSEECVCSVSVCDSSSACPGWTEPLSLNTPSSPRWCLQPRSGLCTSLLPSAAAPLSSARSPRVLYAPPCGFHRCCSAQTTPSAL